MLGGGPAGCAAALRLAQLGRRVVLVERGGPARAHGVETLAPTAAPLLASLGASAALAAARPLPSPCLHWPGVPVAGGAEGVDAVAPAPMAAAGWHVERAPFDAGLRRAAQAAGVTVWHDHAGPARPLGPGWQVPLRGGRVLEAQAVIDARGRRATPPESVARTAVLVARLHGVALAESPAAWASHVEAFDTGWIWAVAAAPGEVLACCFTDAAGLATRADRPAQVAALLARAPALAQRLRGAGLAAVHTGDATPRAADDPAPAHGWFSAGDAAFTIDPLSAQGTVAALRSGVQAAVCVHTALGQPAHEALAREFHRQQCRRVRHWHARAAAALQAPARAAWDTPFWRGRTAACPRRPEPAPIPPDAADAALRVVRAAALRDLEAPTLEGECIVARPAVMHPHWEGPVAWLAGQPVHDWLAGAPRQGPGMPAADLLGTWRARHGPARAEAAWHWLWTAGAIVAAQAEGQR